MSDSEAVSGLRRTIAGFLDATGLRYEVDPEQDFAVFFEQLPDTVVWCVPRPLDGAEGTLVQVMAITNVGAP